MEQLKKDFLIIAAVLGLIGTSALFLSLNRTTNQITVLIPEDVEHKLTQSLIERIEAGTSDTIHDCIIVCNSTEDTYTVVDTLPSESVEQVWDLLGGFHAFLTPEQIFDLARMDEVVMIDYNGIVMVPNTS